jgi:hypothetical protein
MTQHDTSRPLAANTLVPFGSLPGARFAEGEPDIRRWEVRAADGARVGVVEELLVDPATSEIAALAVAADPAGGAGGGLVVLPLASAQVDDRSGAVLSDLTRQQFAALPRGGSSAPAANRGSVAGAASAATSGPASGAQPVAGHPGVTVERTADGEEIVRVPVIEEELVVERRPVVKEMIVIRKRAVRQEQVVEADLRRERVEVDRRDA